MTISNLSERESSVLMEIIKGESNKKIAVKLFLSLSTVKAHVSSIIRKLNVRNRVEAAVKGVYILIENDMEVPVDYI